MALTTAQIADCAAKVADIIFPPGTVATVNWNDLKAAVQALDTAFDTTLTAAATASGGTTTVINYLASVIPAPASGGTAAQKTILAECVLAERVGLI